jgi:hypothetical protein
MSDVRDWLVLSRWSLRERCRRFARVGAYRFEPGTYATVTFGPSAGTVVRLERMAYAPPGCDGRAIHTLQPHGPIWIVDQWLEWVVTGPSGSRLYRFKSAPWTALRAIGPGRPQASRAQYKALGAAHGDPAPG